MNQCLPLSKNVENFDKQVNVLATSNSLIKLMTFETLFIKQFNPVLNTKDKYKSRTLTLKYCLTLLCCQMCMTIIIDTSAEAMRYILNLPLMEDRHKLAQVKAYTRVAVDVSNPLHAKIRCNTKNKAQKRCRVAHQSILNN